MLNSLQLVWHGLYDYNSNNVENIVSNSSGNYMISVGLKEGGYRPIYVGKARELQTRLLDHLSSDETNKCLKERVGNKALYFRFCHASLEDDRQNIEHTLYKRYTPTCNQYIPEGQEIPITFPY